MFRESVLFTILYLAIYIFCVSEELFNNVGPVETTISFFFGNLVIHETTFSKCNLNRVAKSATTFNKIRFWQKSRDKLNKTKRVLWWRDLKNGLEGYNCSMLCFSRVYKMEAWVLNVAYMRRWNWFLNLWIEY